MSIKDKNSLYKLLPLCLLCIVGTITCAVFHSGIRNETFGESSTELPQIIFLNYSIKLDRLTGMSEIILIDKFITEGKLKPGRSEPDMLKPGDLKFVTLNDHMEPVDSLIITDPLNITVESVDENNSLFKKEIARDSAQFSVRMQINNNIGAVAVKKNADSENKNSYLLITKIK